MLRLLGEEVSEVGWSAFLGFTLFWQILQVDGPGKQESLVCFQHGCCKGPIPFICMFGIPCYSQCEMVLQGSLLTEQRSPLF